MFTLKILNPNPNPYIKACGFIKPMLMLKFCHMTLANSSISFFNLLGTNLDPADLICGELLCEKSFNGPFGVKQHLIQGDPVSDGSPL